MRCVEREKLSPAESSFERKICEVHSGVDLVKEIGFSSSQIRITHVTCIEWKMFDIFYKSGTAELTSSLDIAGDEVFLFFRNVSNAQNKIHS